MLIHVIVNTLGAASGDQIHWPALNLQVKYIENYSMHKLPSFSESDWSKETSTLFLNYYFINLCFLSRCSITCKTIRKFEHLPGYQVSDWRFKMGLYRKFSKFGLFLKISANSDWAIQIIFHVRESQATLEFLWDDQRKGSNPMFLTQSMCNKISKT